MDNGWSSNQECELATGTWNVITCDRTENCLLMWSLRGANSCKPDAAFEFAICIGICLCIAMNVRTCMHGPQVTISMQQASKSHKRIPSGVLWNNRRWQFFRPSLDVLCLQFASHYAVHLQYDTAMVHTAQAHTAVGAFSFTPFQTGWTLI